MSFCPFYMQRDNNFAISNHCFVKINVCFVFSFDKCTTFAVGNESKTKPIHIIMNKNLILSLMMTVVTMSVQAQQPTAQGLKLDNGTLTTEVEFYSPRIVRVVRHLSSVQPDKKSLSVTLSPEKVKVSHQKQDGQSVVKSAVLTVSMDAASGALRFSDARGNELLEESSCSVNAIDTGVDKGDYQVSQSWRLDADEPIYGIGLMENGKLSQRGEDRMMIQSNLEDYQHFFQSIKGYGVFWDNYSPTQFKDTPSETTFSSQVGDCLDYYFLLGEDADGVIAQMRHLTGEVPMAPLWTYGFHQSRERYKSSKELIEVLDRHRSLQVPLDGMIQDWQYWGDNYLWNAMEFLNPEFGDAEGMIKHVHDQGAHLSISIWQSFGPHTKAFRELADKNHLMDFETWPQSGVNMWPPRLDYPSGVKVYDAYSSEARDIYWNNLKRLFDMNVDAWWMDSTDPDHAREKPTDLDNATALGSFRKVRNAFPLACVEGVYDHQRAASSDKRVYIFTRSAFAGQQRTGAHTWSGDVGSTWENLRNQIPMGLSFTLTGNPNFNSDSGGFFSGRYNKGGGESGARNPQFQELYVRWLQYSLFCPMMRSHGTDTYREIYYFGKEGEPVYDAIKRTIRMRYWMLPYIYSTAWQVSKRHGSFLRALMMDFKDDKNTWTMGNEFMMGDAFLVVPIVKAQYTEERPDGHWDQLRIDFRDSKTAEAYLPAGAKWVDFWTNKTYDGGQNVTLISHIDRTPLFVRAGSIVPVGPDVQFAAEKPWDDLEIRVYQGADGHFVLYEDEGDGYNYEQGQYTEIPFSWDQRKGVLTIGKRTGSFNGMSATRKFRIVVATEGKAMGDSRDNEAVRTVTYTGKEVKVAL